MASSAIGGTKSAKRGLAWDKLVASWTVAQNKNPRSARDEGDESHIFKDLLCCSSVISNWGSSSSSDAISAVEQERGCVEVSTFAT